MIAAISLAMFFVLFGMYLMMRTAWIALRRSVREIGESYRRNFRA